MSEMEHDDRELRERFAALWQHLPIADAVIDVANDELLLRPGMTANVSFIYASPDDALRVPNAALRFRHDEDRSANGVVFLTLGE